MLIKRCNNSYISGSVIFFVVRAQSLYVLQAISKDSVPPEVVVPQATLKSQSRKTTQVYWNNVNVIQ